MPLLNGYMRPCVRGRPFIGVTKSPAGFEGSFLKHSLVVSTSIPMPHPLSPPAPYVTTVQAVPQSNAQEARSTRPHLLATLLARTARDHVFAEDARYTAWTIQGCFAIARV